MRVLVLNGGSSSFKCALSDLPEGGPLPDEPPQPQWTARADWSHHTGIAEIKITKSDGATVQQQIQVQSPAAVLEPVLKSLPSAVDVVGHRIVHGGPLYRESTPLTAEVRAAIAREVEFAPAHNKFELEAIEAVDRIIGTNVLQIAAFDTGFHATLEPAAYVYAGPYAWIEQGIRRYGFHGISHQYATHRAAAMLGRDELSLKLIVCHLGNGASLAAVRGGKSVDTTMGFTPLEGLMMGTRCGSIDPAILIYLIRHRGSSAEQLDRILNQESGLLGVSGVSGDMREVIEAMQSGNARAQLAFDIYAHRLVREIGGMAAVLGGVDALVFTGGIGENCSPLRELVSKQFAFLGVKLDAAKNAEPRLDQDVAAPDSAVRVLVIRAQEEWEIARECHRLVGSLVTRQPA
jgi:acetate kinase